MTATSTIFILACGLALTYCAPAFDTTTLESLSGADEVSEKINVTLYMESYCPFCKKFVAHQLKDLWNAKDLRDRVVLHLEPGVFAQKMPADKKKNQSKPTWNCLHGKKECKLDRFQLCVMNKHKGEQNVWFPFVLCLESFKGKGGGLKVLKKCSKEHGINYTAMKKCAEGDEGEKLLLGQQPKEDAFLAEPDTKKFVKDNAVDAFKGAIAQAYGALGSTNEALDKIKKIFNQEIEKLSKKDKKGKKGKEDKPKRGFLPYVPLFTITKGGKQSIVQMKDPKVSAISAVCDAIKGTKPSTCTKLKAKSNGQASSSSSSALAVDPKSNKDQVAKAYKGEVKAGVKKEVAGVIAKVRKAGDTKTAQK